MITAQDHKKVMQDYTECPHLHLAGSVSCWSESLSSNAPHLFACAIHTEQFHVLCSATDPCC